MYKQLQQRGMRSPPVNVSTLRQMKEDGVPNACLAGLCRICLTQPS